LAKGRAIIVNGVFAAANGINIGDKLLLQTPKGEREYTVAGVGFDYLNAKIATGYISQNNLAQDFNSDSDVLLLVNRKPNANADQVTRDLKTVVKNYPAFSLIDSSAFKQDQILMFRSLISVFYLMVVMLAVPGLIAMANTMGINVIERRREIGLLRAVGSTREQIRNMIFAESILLSSLGTTMGILVGLFLSYLMIKAIGYLGINSGFYVPYYGILATIAIGLAFGILAALLPARQAAKTVIVEAIQFE